MEKNTIENISIIFLGLKTGHRYFEEQSSSIQRGAIHEEYRDKRFGWDGRGFRDCCEQM